MDDTQDNETPAEDTPELAATGTPGAEPGIATNGSASENATPDAVKAMPIDPANLPGNMESPGSDTPSLGGIAINEPSMDFSQAVPVPADMTEAHRAEFPRFGQTPVTRAPRNMDLLLDVKLPVAIELGRTTMPISDILEWGQGSVIELDKLAGEPVDLLVNQKLVARGEVVVIDEKFGLRITALISNPDAQQSA